MKMTGAKQQYIIAYDITRERRRRRVAHLLKNYGVRIQKSIFECRLGKNSLKELVKRLDELMDRQEDSIIVFPLCRTCSESRRCAGQAVSPRHEKVMII